jgi:hypothetical protein
MDDRSQNFPRIHQRPELADQFQRRNVRLARRRREFRDGHQGCGRSVAHLVDREEREEMAIAYEGLYKRCGGSGLLILVDVGKMEDTISGDGECTPHEGKFMRGEGKLEYKAGRVAVIDNGTQDVDDDVKRSLRSGVVGEDDTKIIYEANRGETGRP